MRHLVPGALGGPPSLNLRPRHMGRRRRYRARHIRSAGNIDCEWRRLRGFGSASSEILGRSRSSEIQTVTIDSSDVGFESRSDCGEWSALPTTGPQATTFGPGLWIVGVDIAPGTYRADGANCSWRRLRGFGENSNDTIEVESATIVEIGPSDTGFSATAACGSWVVAPTTGPQATTFGSGAWIVGIDIAPGIYRSTGMAQSCYWRRVSGFGGGYDESIEVGFAGGIQTVSILVTDAGFSADEDCGTWSLIPTEGSQATSFGPGVWLVGVDIAPGTYRSDGTGGSCFWARLSGFGGTFDESISLEFGSGPQIANIEPT
jgi:hypothetical protein